MRLTKSKAGFTLVELLVVIGIIALLISILLPSLNRARAAAKSIKCRANLHDIGLMFNLYAAGNKGYLPWGQYKSSSTGAWWDSTTKEWTWCDALSLLNTRKTQDQLPSMSWAKSSAYWPIDYLPVFHDPDTQAAGYITRASDYIAHPRILPRSTDIDPRAPNGKGTMSQRTLASISQASQRMMVWDSGVKILSDGLNSGAADLIDTNIDQSAWGWGHAMATSPAAVAPWYNPSSQDNRISIGNNGGGNSINNDVTLATLRKQNRDSLDPYYNGDGASMRFRHIANTEANILFVDGHVEGRTLGSVVQRDILVNPVPWVPIQ